MTGGSRSIPASGTPRCASSAILRAGRSSQDTSGTLKIAPADARSARGPTGSAHSGDSATPAPKASAVRRSVPTFPGSAIRQSPSRRLARQSEGRRGGRHRSRAARGRAWTPRPGARARRSHRRRGARPARRRRPPRPRRDPRPRPRTTRSPPDACAQREASGRAGASRSDAIRSGCFGAFVRPRARPWRVSATAAKACGSLTAMSASDLRSSSIPALRTPAMNRL